MSNWWEDQGNSSWQQSDSSAQAGSDPWGQQQQQQHDASAQGASDAWSTWGNQDSWNNGGAKADGDWNNSPPPAREFWETQEWNKSQGTLSCKEEWELKRDDVALFDQSGRASAGLNFERYERVPVDVSGSKVQAIPPCRSFEEMFSMFEKYMPEALKQNLQNCGYATPTPVQRFAIPCGLVGRDVMCCAQTGSGKTAAFLIPVIGSMMKNHENPVGGLTEPFSGPCKPDVLVITPTRELCIQIYEEALKCCHRTPYRAARVYGGEKPGLQMVDLAKGCDLLVATPGRLQDFINRSIIDVSEVNVLVLDEADRMLDMGFEPQVREIVEKHGMPPKDARQTMMFSATFPDSCQNLAQDFLYDYVWIAVGVMGSAVETVEQVLERVEPAKKYEKLIETLDTFYANRKGNERMLIFTNAKDTAKWLDEQLYEKKFDSGALHGNLTQTERETNLGRFRRGEIDVLIATDVAARGLDIESVAVVVNYDLPQDLDTYIHRIGRTGRIGNEGRAISFIACEEDGSSLEAVHNLKALVKCIESSRQTSPDWLEHLIEKTEEAKTNGGWSWGGRDTRSGQEQYKASGTGDAWANWGKSQAQDGGWGNDSWEAAPSGEADGPRAHSFVVMGAAQA
eukprot:CAMPEP_0176072392 /NCGR_PEP_ID=MMETSP0120_2-20121206/36164_1 /TAXON_ID=160619 /ORGANISM="Kryptoperidinium foliaceum, Strain CCMP 1326" /LENGTH=624 /DNA_ID=CAMNT_0017406061 /DNA_START=40 /DNA_END=1911 /DNA_ORIENTATION=-